MKKRIFNMLNFLALNILFFAIYLNFIHKDVNILPAASSSVAAKKISTTAFSKDPVVAATKQKLHPAEN